jgi:hypothetical protein
LSAPLPAAVVASTPLHVHLSEPHFAPGASRPRRQQRPRSQRPPRQLRGTHPTPTEHHADRYCHCHWSGVHREPGSPTVGGVLHERAVSGENRGVMHHEQAVSGSQRRSVAVSGSQRQSAAVSGIPGAGHEREGVQRR